jgi:FdhE protein
VGFAVNWALSAVLHAARMAWIDTVGRFSWDKGYCPLCGSMPAIGFLARPRGPAPDGPVCGGGQKYLFCALCGHQWRIERYRCPVCDTGDKENLCYYQESGEPGERIDACISCGHYLLCIDVRLWEQPPPMEVAAVGMIHLDILARDRGFSPMAWTPWNRIDDP